MPRELTAEDFELPYDDEEATGDEDQGSYDDSESLDLDLDAEDEEDGQTEDFSLEDDEDDGESEDEAPLARKKAKSDDIEKDKGLRGRLNEYEKRGHRAGYGEGYAAAKAEFDGKLSVLEKRFAALETGSLESEAQALAKEKNLDIEDARLLARAKRGLPDDGSQQEGQEKQARDAQGRFTQAKQQQQSEVSPEIEARAQMLMQQNETIKATLGIDVLKLFNSDEKVREAVRSGKHDFASIAKLYMKQHGGARRVPVTARNASPGRITGNDIASMTDAQLEKLDRYLEQGGKIRSNGRR
jgi:hypothetical protein